MNRLIFLIIFMPFTFLFSQNPNYGQFSVGEDIYGKVFGVVKDSDDSNYLPYANVSLYKLDNQSDTILVNGTISDDEGNFLFEKLTIDSYFIEISYNGYSSKNIDFEISGKKLNKNLKNIFLKQNSLLLEGVNVSTEAPIYENKIEKIVYNVGNDLSQTANDGIDVLRNAPLVSVDINDEVSLRGSSNVKFLLNGKTSSFLNESNVTNVLQAIPAEQIKSIEVITSPSAKYDADGDAGIINIITNQKVIEGFNASVKTNTGTRVNRTSFNLNAGKNRFGISASGGARYGWPRDGKISSENITYDNNGNMISRYYKSGTFVGNWVGYRGSVDMYYDINKYNNITSNIQISGHDKFNNAEEIGVDTFPYILGDTTSNKDTEYEYTINYNKTFPKKEGQELIVSLQYGGHVHDDDKYLNQSIVWDSPDLTVNQPITQVLDNTIDNMMFGDGYELTGQVDYVHPFGDENKIEIGLKRINRFTTNIYTTDISNINVISWLPSDSLNNTLQYDQKVSAAYASSTFNLVNDFGILMGFRYEKTNISGLYDNYFPEFKNEYDNIVPSITISKKINMFNTFKVSYVNRIQRPDIHKINTNIEITDLNNISKGNPNLEPSNSHQIELGYTSFKPGLMTTYFIYYKEKNNLVEQYVSLITDGVYETNYLNAGTNKSFGFNFFGSTTIRKKLTLRGSFDLYTYNMSTDINNVKLSRQSLNYKYMLSANMKLGKGYKVESRTFFRSPRQSVQGERPSFSMLSFGFKKDFANKRGSIGLGMIEPFSKYKSFDTEIDGEMEDGRTFSYRRDYKIAFRSVNISFNYKFGKINYDPIKKKAILENNDTMDDDGGGEGY